MRTVPILATLPRVHVLTEPFTRPFIERAWLELALLSVPAGVLGVFVVLRRLAFATHALGVATFPGLVAAAGLGISAFAGGLVSAVALAGLLAVLQRRRDLDAAASTGLLLAGALSAGALLVSDVFPTEARADTALFGSLLGVESADLGRAAAIAGVTWVAFVLFGRRWLAVAFDRETAKVLGFDPALLDGLLLVLLATAVVAMVDAVGALLVSALVVVPPALARLFVARLWPLVTVSIALVLLFATGGLIVGYWTGAPPGATIAVTAAGGFIAAAAIRALARSRGARSALAAAACVAVVLVTESCGGQTGGHAIGGDRRLQVVATTTQVADWARAVGGQDADVTQLLRPNVDPHDFEPTSKDVAAVSDADLVLASGAGLDDWIADAAANAGGGAPVVTVAPTALLRPPVLAGEGEVDPHFWHDPTLAIRAVRTIAAAMGRADPSHAAAFRDRANRYVNQLEALDAELRRDFAAVPATERKLVTDHDAFGYLAARYGITVVGAAIPSTSTAAEPSAGETAKLIDTIRREDVHTVFSEQSVDPKLVEQIAREAGATVVSDLYGDTLGPPGSDAATYLQMMRHNARELVAGFTR